MLDEKIKELALSKYHQVKNGTIDRGSYINAGYARSVYAINDELVIKIEYHEEVFDAYWVTNDLLREREVLNKELMCEKINKFPLTKLNDSYFKFINALELQVDEFSINKYIQFKDHDCDCQNLPDYFNYLEVKDTELSKYLPKSLGVLFVENDIILIQEKMEIVKRSMALYEKRDSIVKEFKDKGYILLDIKLENVMCNKKGDIKICDTGVSNLTKEKHYCGFESINDDRKRRYEKSYLEYKENIW